MTSFAYYNENNPEAAAWLRELIKEGHIAPGVVDDRDMEDVVPDELHGFKQHHFCAGIGVWSYALRRAGWDDDRPVWTASLPCQPFSKPGSRIGFADHRHLWPVFFHLLVHGKPRDVVVIGEQVSSDGGLEWLDLISADLERADHAVGAVDTCAASVGAPHIRQRLYWLAQAGRAPVDPTGRLADAGLARLQGSTEAERPDQLAVGAHGVVGGHAAPGPVNGFWRDADWLLCEDQRWRVVEAGTFPMDAGAAARVGRLRGYGNALCAPQAEAFIVAAMEVLS
jgi:DNA (cytosine-5)-methyltransferase 1